MNVKRWKDAHVFEIMLLIVILGMTMLFFEMGEYRLVALNLFYMPVMLAGYYLGRSTAGILALFCTLSVTIASTLQMSGLAAYDTPVMIGLVLTIWAAVLGLTAILMGTLCDERARTVIDLHKAYVGVVEVLSKYLQSGNPHIKARSVRVSELSQLVAEELRLGQKTIDDIRVAALLRDLENVEITTALISNAMHTLETSSQARQYTFQGVELAQSLGDVLESAMPLLVSSDAVVSGVSEDYGVHGVQGQPIGIRIISAVRDYDALVHCSDASAALTTDQAIRELRHRDGEYCGDVLAALTRVVQRPKRSREPVPALV